MDYDFKQTRFSKAVMVGLFSGIVATLLNLIYDYIYRAVTNLSPSEIINVSSLIFGSLVILMIAGVVFFLMERYLKKGKSIYTILFIALTVLSIVAALSVQRSPNPQITAQFRGLLIGVNIILGSSAAFLISRRGFYFFLFR